MQLINLQSNEVIAEEIKGAYTFWKRFKGLMLTKNLPKNSALHIKPCRSIHTFFMNYSIDVIYLNKQNEIVGIEENLETSKLGKKFSHATSVIELPAGTVKRKAVTVGQAVAFIDKLQNQIS